MENQNSPKPTANGRRRFIKSSLGGAALAAMPLSVAAEVKSDRAKTKAKQTTIRKRKNVKDLRPQEKEAFTQGILQLKRTASPFFKNNMLSYYDSIVRIHQLAVIQSRHQGWGVGHKCPSLLPFHRKLVLLLEDALQSVTKNTNITVPYWDWTDESSTDIVFNEDFMGEHTGLPENNYAVMTGPFKKGDYELNLITVPDGDNDYLNFCPFTYLTRGPRTGNTGLMDFMKDLPLPTQEEVDLAMACENYDVTPYNPSVDRTKSFRNYLGGWGKKGGAPTLHNVVHTWTGGAWNAETYRYSPADSAWVKASRPFVGTMQALQTSANDPVFFLHHSNVDRIWAEWQAKDGNGGLDGYPEYKDGDTAYKKEWRADGEIPVFAAHKDIPEMNKDQITNGSMLDITELGYEYV